MLPNSVRLPPPVGLTWHAMHFAPVRTARYGSACDAAGASSADAMTDAAIIGHAPPLRRVTAARRPGSTGGLRRLWSAEDTARTAACGRRASGFPRASG